MKKYILGVLLIGLALCVQQTHRVNAVTGTLYTSKNIPLTIIITPSPVAYVPITRNGIVVGQRSIQPPDANAMVAYEQYEMQDVVAQATSSPQGNVKVNFTVKLDPTSQYLHLTPVTNPLYAGYGPNTWACAYDVYAYYPGYAYYVDDVVQGSTSSGSGPFPAYNAPTTSILLWQAYNSTDTTPITASMVAFANGGGIGQQTFTGTAGEKQTNCMNLSLNVPTTIAPGTYQATITYSLYVEL